ncbi:F0F1 ATP synthase subunit B [Cardinium endosymbiont of Tipula unca]|uniref:F0F1 ATP synthase subunit B n=1 Tax=Cardinium endosymbiont of Tipula unca TaxID=3066216 RepID=UPI0030CF8C04
MITPNFGIIFWQTITFFTVLVVLSRYAWRPILGILKQREEAIAHAVEQIAESQELMQQATYEKAKLLGDAHLKREQIIGEALEAQKGIMHQAHQEALAFKEQLLTQARVEIAREEAHAIEMVKKNMGSLAIQMAEKLLIKELSRDRSHLELIERLTAGESQSA